MQKMVWWWGAKPKQVGSWVMMLMSPCLPPSPLQHPWFKCWLHRSAQTAAGNRLGASARRARGGSRGTGCFEVHQGGLLAWCGMVFACQLQALVVCHGHAAWPPSSQNKLLMLGADPNIGRLERNQKLPLKCCFSRRGGNSWWGVLLVAECDSRLQRLEVFVKGDREASEAKRCFQEESE